MILSSLSASPGSLPNLKATIKNTKCDQHVPHMDPHVQLPTPAEAQASISVPLCTVAVHCLRKLLNGACGSTTYSHYLISACPYSAWPSLLHSFCSFSCHPERLLQTCLSSVTPRPIKPSEINAIYFPSLSSAWNHLYIFIYSFFMSNFCLWLDLTPPPPFFSLIYVFSVSPSFSSQAFLLYCLFPLCLQT